MSGIRNHAHEATKVVTPHRSEGTTLFKMRKERATIVNKQQKDSTSRREEVLRRRSRKVTASHLLHAQLEPPCTTRPSCNSSAFTTKTRSTSDVTPLLAGGLCHRAHLVSCYMLCVIFTPLSHAFDLCKAAEPDLFVMLKDKVT